MGLKSGNWFLRPMWGNIIGSAPLAFNISKSISWRFGLCLFNSLIMSVCSTVFLIESDELGPKIIFKLMIMCSSFLILGITIE
jgi:hypothetical protein